MLPQLASRKVNIMSDLICMIAIGLNMLTVFMTITIGSIPRDEDTRKTIHLSGAVILIVIVACTAYALCHIETTYETVDKNIKIASVKELKNNDKTSYAITTDDNDEYNIAYKCSTYNENTCSFVHIKKSETDEYKIISSTTYKTESVFGRSIKEKDTYDIIVEVPSDVYDIYKYGNNTQITDVKL